MKTKLTTSALVMAIVAMSMGTVRADDQTFDAQAEVAALKNEIARLRSQSEESWLNERRTEEVKTLIREVLSDADTRASLAEGGMTAGHNGKNFFLSSEDGKFLMQISGQIQVRYTYNNRDGVDTGPGSSTFDDDNEFGLELRRTKLRFDGHIADPKLHYTVQFEVDRATNELVGDIITIAYDLTDTLTIWAGEDKAPFLREEMTSSSRQLAAERSYVNEYFTWDVVQGVGVVWDVADALRVQGNINDGPRSGEPSSDGDKAFYSDNSDFAAVGRVDWKIAGTWDQFKDFTSFPGEEMFLQVGGAVAYLATETGDDTSNDQLFSWTVDASFEYQGLNIFAAYIMAHTDNESGSDNDPWGLVAQIGYNIDIGNGNSLEPFFRYEHLDYDTGGEDNVDILTFGANWYHAKHAAKLTADVVWALDPILTSFSGGGLLNDSGLDDADDQIAVRVQYQVLF